MTLRFTLHGGYDSETNEVRQLLDKSGILYRFEGSRDYEELVLVTPAGRFSGLKNIEEMFKVEAA